MTSPAHSQSSPPKLQRRMPLFLLLLGAFTYHNSLHGPFIFDDVRSIVENSHIRKLWPVQSWISAPVESAVAGRSMVSLSLALNYAWGGLDVRGYHVLNIALHLANALLLFGIVRRSLESPRLSQSFGSRSYSLAWVAAAIWMVHPLLTESVDYVIQRTELLMAFFFLLTLYAAIRRWHVAAIVACFLGVASKEVMVVAPMVVITYDWVSETSSFRETLRRRRFLYGGLFASWLLLSYVVMHGQAQTGPVGFNVGITPWNYLLTQCGVIMRYLQLAVWPSPLVLDYDDWPIAQSLVDAFPGGVILCGILAGTLWALAKRSWLGFVGACFFLILGPTSSVLPIITEIVAERRMYLPLAGLVVLVVLGVDRLLTGDWALRLGKSTPMALKVSLAATAILFLTAGTLARNEDYRTVIGIWQDAVTKRPSSSRAHVSLGVALATAGRAGEAIVEYRKAIELNPKNEHAHSSLGMALSVKGENAQAMGEFIEAIKIRPNYVHAHFGVANLLSAMGQFPEAISHYEKSIAARPDHVKAHFNLGCVYIRMNNYSKAIAQFRESLRIEPNDSKAHTNLGVSLVHENQFKEACLEFEEALRIDPKAREARVNLELLKEMK